MTAAGAFGEVGNSEGESRGSPRSATRVPGAAPSLAWRWVDVCAGNLEPLRKVPLCLANKVLACLV